VIKLYCKHFYYRSTDGLDFSQVRKLHTVVGKKLVAFRDLWIALCGVWEEECNSGKEGLNFYFAILLDENGYVHGSVNSGRRATMMK